MIIGIGGKQESGKGTVCNIIQAVSLYYNCPKKTKSWGTLDEFVWSYVRENRKASLAAFRDIYSDWKIVAFADKLKAIVSIITECSVDKLYTHEGKNALSPIKNPNSLSNYTYRELLQLIGTEVGRVLSPNVWIDSLFFGYDDQNWLIEDVRFPNELAKIKQIGGFTILCKRADQIQSDHSSETALDTLEDNFDEVIWFDETLKSQTEKIVKILTKLGIINI